MKLLRGRSLAATAVAGAVVLGGAGWAHAASSNDDPNYRVAAASKADVAQTLALSGTLARSSTSSLSFGAAGTVSKVAVSVGSTVKRGQVIARLDDTDLKADVSAAEAKVAKAKAALASDKQAQIDAVAAAADADEAAAAATASAAKAKKQAAAAAKKQAAATAAAAAKLREQQGAVTSAQTAATKALTQASDALAAQAKACASAYTLTDPTDPSSVDASATQACTAALENVSTAQGAAQSAQATLQKSLTTLSSALGGSGGSGGSDGSNSAGASSSATGSGSQSGSASGSTSGGSASGGASGAGGAREVTAATLASDQASIDLAEVDLITAKQDLDGAVLAAPTAGTIGALDLVEGDAASAGSAIGTLLGSGTVTVTLSVSATQAADLAANQVAEVLPAGAEEALAAHVTRVSHVASSDSTGSSTYPVLVTLDDGDTTLPDGGTAAVDVVIGSAEEVLTVPTSAVSNGSVTVLSGGTATRTRVTTGLVGASLTQITDGLAAGDDVVLADIDAALPTSSTSSTTRRFGNAGSGGFGGASGGFSGGGLGVGGR